MAVTPPVTVAQFKAQFARDFTFGDGRDAVMDSDVNRALLEAMVQYNPAIWGDDPSSFAFMYLAAHYMVLNVQAAGGLRAKGRPTGILSRGEGSTQSKSVGPVAVAFAVPERVASSPILNMYMQTAYGQKYLSLLAPRLVGNASAVAGPTDPQAAIPFLSGGF